MVERALSLHQPYASALFVPGLKTIETRSWRVDFRGRLWIHASKTFPAPARAFAAQRCAEGDPLTSLFFGVVLGCVDLFDCVHTEMVLGVFGKDADYGDFSRGRFAWLTRGARLLPEPIPAKGKQGIWGWNPPPHVEQWLREAA